MRAMLALLLLLPPLLPEAHARKKSGSRYPAVRLYHVNFGKSIRYNLYDPKGFPQKGPMRRLERIMRCHHTGKRHRIHWRLQQLIYRVARHFPAQRLEIVSGYRDPKIARRKGVPKSYHTRGRALDFRVPGVSNERVRNYVRTFKKVGVGYYPNSTFVHLDVRDKRGAYWVDESAPGASAKKQGKDPDGHAEAEKAVADRAAGSGSERDAPAKPTDERPTSHASATAGQTGGSKSPNTPGHAAPGASRASPEPSPAASGEANGTDGTTREAAAPTGNVRSMDPRPSGPAKPTRRAGPDHGSARSAKPDKSSGAASTRASQ